MATLIIDTSSSHTVCAVCTFDKILSGGVFSNDHIRDQLPIEMSKVVIDGKIEIDEIVLGIGPGFYTGLRAGSIVAQSFGYCNRIPIRKVQSLKGLLPIGYPNGKYLLIALAGRSRYYGVSFSPENLFSETSTMFSLEELCDAVKGEVAVLSSVDKPKVIEGKWVNLLPDPLRLLREAHAEKFFPDNFYSGLLLEYLS